MKNTTILLQDLTSCTDLEKLALPPPGFFVHWILNPVQFSDFLRAQNGAFRRLLDLKKGTVLPHNLTGIHPLALFTQELSSVLRETYKDPTLGLQNFLPGAKGPVFFWGGEALLGTGKGLLDQKSDWITPCDHGFVGQIQGVEFFLPKIEPGRKKSGVLILDEKTPWPVLPKGTKTLSWECIPSISKKFTPALGLLPAQKEQIIRSASKRLEIDFPQILLPLGENWFQAPGPQPGTIYHLGGVKERALVANMQGTTDFRESGQVANFRGGRFMGLRDQSNSKQKTGPTRAFYQVEGKTYHFATVSAFSMEGTQSWGIRETLLLEGEPFVTPGRLNLDSFFLNDTPEFCISATLRHPRFRREAKIQGWGGLEWLLFTWAPWETITVQILSPDSETSPQTLPRRKKPGVLKGAGFLFQKKDFQVTLTFPQNQGPRPHILPFRLGKIGHLTGLVINPEGVYGQIASKELDNWEEHFNIQVRLNSPNISPLNLTDQGREEFIPPYCRKL